MTTVTIYDAARVDALLAAERLAARMNALPPQPRKDLITDTIAGLMAAGVWDKLDGLYVMAAHSEQAARLNWRGAGAQDLTAVNSPIFAPDKGFTGDGATSYLDTGLAGNRGECFQQNSAHLSVWVLTNIASNIGHDISGAGNAYINTRAVSGAVVCRINSGATSTSTATPAESRGMTTVCRRSATDVCISRNGVSIHSETNESVVLASANFLIGRNQVNYSPRQIAFASIGASLTDAEVAALYSAVAAYLTAVGAVS